MCVLCSLCFVTQFFLVKSEPDAFSINQLEERPNQTEGWDGEVTVAAQSYYVALWLKLQQQ
jgi:predicted RNA-binding protein with PUA-like domain